MRQARVLDLVIAISISLLLVVPGSEVLEHSPVILGRESSGTPTHNDTAHSKSSGGLAPTLQPAANWTNITATTGTFPGGGKVVYDSADGYLLEYGGINQNQTYALKGRSWTHINTTVAPISQNDGEGLAYDPISKEVVMYGGTTIACGAPCSNNQTWVYSSGSWKEIATPSAMPAATVASMDWDPATSSVIALLGYCTTNTGNCPSTWSFANGTWTQVPTSTTPSERCGSANFYDPTEGLIMFGGANCFLSPLNDTWVFSGGNWVQKNPTPTPAPGYLTATYDPATNYAIAYGTPYGKSSTYGSTWEFSVGNWTNVTATAGLTNSGPAGMSYVPTFGTILMVDSYGDTWSWGPPSAVYNATFEESGLPAGIPWSVSVNGTVQSAVSPSNVTVLVANGTQRVLVSTPLTSPQYEYTPSPTSFNIAISGKSAEFNVTFLLANLAVRVHNVNGQWASNLSGSAFGVLYYYSNYSQANLPREYVSLSGMVSWPGLSPGKYILEVYHYPRTGLNDTEFWGDATYSVTSGSNTTVSNFTRWTPWISSVDVALSTLAENQTETVFVSLTQSNLGWNITAQVNLWITRNPANLQGALHQSPQVVIGPGRSYNLSFTFGLKTPGLYYYYIEALGQFGGGIAVTDQFAWTPAMTVTNETSYPLNIDETGIPTGIYWTALVDGAVENTSANKMFSEPNGTHSIVTFQFTVPGGWEYLPGSPKSNVTVAGPTTFREVFQVEYLLWVSTIGLGTVTPGSGYYNPGSVISVTATTAYGSHFTGWTGTGPGNYSGPNPSASVTLNAPVMEEAVFVGGVHSWRTDPNFTVIPILGSSSITLGFSFLSWNIPIPFGLYYVGPATGKLNSAYNASLAKWFGLSQSDYTYDGVLLFQVEGVGQFVQSANSVYNDTLGWFTAHPDMMQTFGQLFDPQGNLTFFAYFSENFSGTSLTKFFSDVTSTALKVLVSSIKSGDVSFGVSELKDLFLALFDIFNVEFGVMQSTSVAVTNGTAPGFTPYPGLYVDVGAAVQYISQLESDYSSIVDTITNIIETGGDCLSGEEYGCATGIVGLVLSGISYAASYLAPNSDASTLISTGLDWFTSITDPNGTTAYPSLQQNGSTVLGYDPTNGTTMWGSPSGYVVGTNGCWEVQLANATYNDTLSLQQTGSPSTPVPYITEVSSLEGGGFALGSGVVTGGEPMQSTLNLTLHNSSVNVTWAEAAQFSNVSVHLNSSVISIQGTLLSQGQPVPAGEVYWYVNGSVVSESILSNGEFDVQSPFVGVNVTGFLESWVKGQVGASFPLNYTRPQIQSFTASRPVLAIGNVTYLNLSVIGGRGLIVVSYEGLPPGCLSTDVLSLSCVPNATGTYHVRAYANDSYGNSAAASTTLVVYELPKVISLSFTPNPVTVGDQLFLNVTAEGGLGPLTYAYSGLPSGCPSSNSSHLSCIPQATGVYTVQVFVNDTDGHTAKLFGSLTVFPQLSLKSFTATPSTVKVYQSVSLSVTVSGGIQPYTYTYGNLPGGCVSMNSSFVTCVPATVGSFNVSVVVTDSRSVRVQGGLTLDVIPTAPPDLLSVTIHATPTSVPERSEISAFATPVCTTTCPSNIQYLWKVNNSLASLSVSTGSSTVLTAGNQTGSVTLTVSASLGNSVRNATATIVILAPPSTPTPPKNGGQNTPLDVALLLVPSLVVVALFGTVLLLRKRADNDPVRPGPRSRNQNEGAEKSEGNRTGETSTDVSTTDQ